MDHEPQMVLDTPGARLCRAGPLLLLEWREVGGAGPVVTRARRLLGEPGGPDVALVRASLPICARPSRQLCPPLALAPHARALGLIVPDADDAGRHLARATLALRTALARLERPWLIAPRVEAVARWCARDLDPPVAAHRVIDLLHWACGAPDTLTTPRRAA